MFLPINVQTCTRTHSDTLRRADSHMLGHAPIEARLQPSDAFIALGVLSSAGDFETGRATAAKSELMRQRVREAADTAGPASTHGVALRFVLSAWSRSHGKTTSALDLEAIQNEQSSHGDLVFLNMTERFYLCAWKSVAR